MTPQPNDAHNAAATNVNLLSWGLPHSDIPELEAKYILLLLFAMGGLAVRAGSEAVLPAYIIGMILAGTVGKDHILVAPAAIEQQTQSS